VTKYYAIDTGKLFTIERSKLLTSIVVFWSTLLSRKSDFLYFLSLLVITNPLQRPSSSTIKKNKNQSIIGSWKLV